MSAKFTSTKTIPLGSTAFRQPYATSHCRYLHGYRLQAKFWFTCNNLDGNNWVVDFGALLDLKKQLEEKFDHTTCIAANDPQKAVFEMLHEKGIIDLRVFPDGVGIEKFAEYCLNTANAFVKRLTQERCWCEKVEVWEHENNSATFENNNTSTEYEYLNFNTNTTTEIPQPPVLISEVKQTVPTPEPTVQVPVPEPTKVPEPPKRIVPQYTDKTKNSFRDPFKGTSWGNPT